MEIRTNRSIWCVGAGSDRCHDGSSCGEELRWSEEQRRGSVGTGLCFLHVRDSFEKNVFEDFGFVWATILCYRVYWGLNVYLTWQLLIGGINSPFFASSGQNVFSFVFGCLGRHHQHGRWQARIWRVAGKKDLYLGTFSKFQLIYLNTHQLSLSINHLHT